MEKKRQRRQKSAYISSSILKAINMHNLSLRVCVYIHEISNRYDDYEDECKITKTVVI